MMQILNDELRARAGTIAIVDIGALWTEKTPPYEALVRLFSTSIVGFEPIEEECRRLNDLYGPKNTFLPYAIGDGTLQIFHRNNYDMTSSLYEPDLELMNRYQNLSQYCQVIARSEIQTHRLDEVLPSREVDFLKVDVQGAELAVFSGAPKTLQEVLVVQTEIEFLPIYREQPLFADVDTHLRRAGFEFHHFAETDGRALSSYDEAWDVASNCRQMLWGDAVYTRSRLKWDELPAYRLMRFAAIMDAVYEAKDFAHNLLRRYDRLEGTALSEEYLKLYAGI